jgi:fumarate hydratase subunit beta
MNDKEKKILRYREENKAVKYGQTVFTGSSLMEMFPINKLLAEHNDSEIVYNRGIGGFVSRELLEVIDVCAIDLKPSKIFINIGTNDLSDSSIPISELIENYDKIISEIETKLPNTIIYLMAYYPVNYEAADENMKECLKIRNNEKIRIANTEVKKLAEKHSQRYIDINKNLMDEQGRLRAEYTIEGLHINEDGYRAVYHDIITYVKEPILNHKNIKMDKHITVPLTNEDIKTLRAGDYIYLSGTIYTARDAAHLRMNKALDQNNPLPISLEHNIIYYMGPSPAREGRPIGSAGPTTASRMDKYTPRLLDLGLKGMIGKGRRSGAVKEAIVRNHAVYFAAVGGAGALLSKSITASEVVAYDDLGTEAIRKLIVKNFPVIVVIDAEGNNLYETAVK